MRTIQSLLIIFCFSSFLSCNNKQSTSAEIQEENEFSPELLIGSWEDQSSAALHFSILENGKAQSDNMSTLLYQSWELEGNQLSLTAESIGNGTSSVDTEVFTISELNNSKMVLMKDNVSYSYLRTQSKAQRADTASATVKGKLILGYEGRSFQPCDSDKVFYVIDRTGEMEEIYNELIKGQKLYTPVFAEVEVVEKPKSLAEFAADYDGLYEIVKFHTIRNLTSTDCK